MEMTNFISLLRTSIVSKKKPHIVQDRRLKYLSDSCVVLMIKNVLFSEKHTKRSVRLFTQNIAEYIIFSEIHNSVQLMYLPIISSNNLHRDVCSRSSMHVKRP